MKIHLLLCAFFAFASLCAGHGRMDDPSPRSPGNQQGPGQIGESPCGDLAMTTWNEVGASRHCYILGEQVMLSWIISADHGGNVSIRYSMDGTNNFPNVIIGSIDRNVLTVPFVFNEPCDPSCVLQWEWRPNPLQEIAEYFTCSDFKVATPLSNATVTVNVTTFVEADFANAVATELNVTVERITVLTSTMDGGTGMYAVTFTVEYDNECYGSQAALETTRTALQAGSSTLANAGLVRGTMTLSTDVVSTDDTDGDGDSDGDNNNGEGGAANSLASFLF